MGGVEGFTRLLATVRVAGLDSMAFIYHFEANPRYGPLTQALFAHIEDGGLQACTSVLTLTEVLTGALKAGDTSLAQLYRQVLGLMPNLTMQAIDLESAALAAELRAQAGLRTPDALQVAAALRGGADVFITNDVHLRQIARIRVALLEDYA